MNKMWLNEAIAESLFGWGFYNRQPVTRNSAHASYLPLNWPQAAEISCPLL